MGILSLTALMTLQSSRKYQFCCNSCECGFAEAAAGCRDEMGRVGNTGLTVHKTQSIRAEVYDQHFANSAARALGNLLQVEALRV